MLKYTKETAQHLPMTRLPPCCIWMFGVNNMTHRPARTLSLLVFTVLYFLLSLYWLLLSKWIKICISWHDGSTAVYRSGTVIYHNNLCGTMVVHSIPLPWYTIVLFDVGKLLSPSCYGLQKLNVCEHFASTWDIKFNPAKSQLITFGGKTPHDNKIIKFIWTVQLCHGL